MFRAGLVANLRQFMISLHFRLHRMQEMQTIVTDVRGACPPVSQSVTRLN